MHPTPLVLCRLDTVLRQPRNLFRGIQPRSVSEMTMPLLSWLAQTVPFVRRVYVLPQLLDVALLAHTLVRHPEKARAMHALEAEVLNWPGVSTTIHRYGGTELRVGNHEIGHLHGHGLLDILLTRAMRDAVVGAQIARPHHIFPLSAWVSFDIRSAADVSPAATLLRRNYERLLEKL